ncbi:MAG: hypothetical protein N3E41_08725 [Thermofilaceae archaeon]|nr:hypothetical protein [Thermofilaceae archaeon]
MPAQCLSILSQLLWLSQAEARGTPHCLSILSQLLWGKALTVTPRSRAFNSFPVAVI